MLLQNFKIHFGIVVQKSKTLILPFQENNNYNTESHHEIKYCYHNLNSRTKD